MQETYVYATARVVYLDPSVYLRDFSEPVPNTTLKKTLEDVGGGSDGGVGSHWFNFIHFFLDLFPEI